MKEVQIGDHVVVNESVTGHEFQAMVIDIRDFDGKRSFIVEDQDSDLFTVELHELEVV